MNEVPNKRKACPQCMKLCIHFHSKKNLWNCYSCQNIFETPLEVQRETIKRSRRKIAPGQTIESREVILRKINNVPDYQVKALLSMMYFTGGRVSELCQNKDKPSIKKHQVEFKDGYLQVKNLPVFKRRFEMFRNPKRSQEPELIGNILAYVEDLEDEQELFPFKRGVAWKRIKKHIPEWYPHFLRHACTTHLYTVYGLKDMEVRTFLEWADLRQASRYAHLEMEEIAKKL